jgi:SAM-dependent methyltransferase
MTKMPYDEFTDYLIDIINHAEITNKRIVDIACGTGTLLTMMAKRGYKCTGVDGSPDMIKIARDKTTLAKLHIDYHVQDITNLKLPIRAPIITCLYDSINYLLTKNQLKKCFKTVYNNLQNNGIFVFDINTERGLSNVWGTKTKRYKDKTTDITCKTGYNTKTKLGQMHIFGTTWAGNEQIFINETHFEKVYSLSEITDILYKSRFNKISVYTDRSFDKVTAKTTRAWFVAHKLAIKS